MKNREHARKARKMKKIKAQNVHHRSFTSKSEKQRRKEQKDRDAYAHELFVVKGEKSMARVWDEETQGLTSKQKEDRVKAMVGE